MTAQWLSNGGGPTFPVDKVYVWTAGEEEDETWRRAGLAGRGGSRLLGIPVAPPACARPPGPSTPPH
jgi:hypothetical protein